MEYEIDTQLWHEEIEVEHIHQRPRWRKEQRDRDPQRGILIPEEEFV